MFDTDKWLNDSSIQHRCKYGVNFKANRGDLRGGVTVTYSKNVGTQWLAEAFAEFGAWHATHIHPRLNGFQGYDCVKYAFKEEN